MDRSIRVALIQMAALGGLCLLVYRVDIARMAEAAFANPEWAHSLVAPVLVGLLAFLRRRELVASLRQPGSAWGLVILAAALLLYAGSAFPFNYSYPRRFSLVPALAGVVVATAGWRFALRCAPMLLLVLLAVPIPIGEFVRLVIRPETLTLKAAAISLDMLPGVLVELQGADLRYISEGAAGTVALGEPWRGASMLLATASLGIFVIFSRIRPWWQGAILLAATPVLVLVVNLFRLDLWGILVIYGRADPLSPAPRIVATIGAFLACYGAFCLAGGLIGRKKAPGAFSADALPRTQSPLGPAEKAPGAFIAAAALLAVSAAALQPVLDSLVTRYTKEPIAVRRPLDQFDTAAIASFRTVTDDPSFKIEVDPIVGTDDAVRRVFQPRAGAERRRDEDTLLFVTYYNDPRDTIPHTPEVCYRQVGSIVHSIKTITIPVRGLGPEPVDVQARLLDLEPPGWHGALVYVFVCNGRFYHDRKSVRWAIGWPGDKRIYFSKVEVVSRCGPGDDCRAALERATAVLAEALPVLMRDHFPATADVER